MTDEINFEEYMIFIQENLPFFNYLALEYDPKTIDALMPAVHNTCLKFALQGNNDKVWFVCEVVMHIVKDHLLVNGNKRTGVNVLLLSCFYFNWDVKTWLIKPKQTIYKLILEMINTNLNDERAVLNTVQHFKHLLELEQTTKQSLHEI